MGWDVLLLPLPADAASVDDLPSGHEPPPVGSRARVHRALGSAVGGVDLTDPAWGELRGPGWVIELGIGEDDPVGAVMLHVRGGGDDVLPVIFRIARALGCRLVDCSTGELLAEDGASAARDAFRAFRAFRDGALADRSPGRLSDGR